MEMIPVAVFAGAFLRDLRESTGVREQERPDGCKEAGACCGLRDVARAAGALGGVALLAALSLAVR